MVRTPLSFWCVQVHVFWVGKDIRNLNGLAFEQRAPHDVAASGDQRNGPDKCIDDPLGSP